MHNERMERQFIDKIKQEQEDQDRREGTATMDTDFPTSLYNSELDKYINVTPKIRGIKKNTHNKESFNIYQKNQKGSKTDSASTSWIDMCYKMRPESEEDMEGKIIECMDSYTYNHTSKKPDECWCKGCTNEVQGRPTSITIYTPGLIFAEIELCEIHKRHIETLWEELYECINTLWAYGGQNPLQPWRPSSTGWYHVDLLRMMKIVLRHTEGLLKDLLRSFDENSLPLELYKGELIINGNIALCEHVIKERQLHNMQQADN